MRVDWRRALGAALGANMVASIHLPGQMPHRHAADSARGAKIGAMAVGVYTNANPGVLKQRVSEAYLTQPMVMGAARAFGGRLQAYAIVNAEGATLQRGEINPGMYGEGYVDRRHPHTWMHEAMIGGTQRAGAMALSLFGGKGFVPYGSDDPMMRPFVKYPVNHHHAQLLERAMVTATLQVRGFGLEGARFNGDEPESPGDWPNADRLFDSWSLRGTFTPMPTVDLSASTASVQSPEFAQGDGLDQRKVAVSARLFQQDRRLRYALVEYASTREFSGTRQVFDFSSLLGEAEVDMGALAFALRAERTTRPEEERARSFYRTIRPLLDFNILGRTQWTNLTLQLSHRGWGNALFAGRPFMEGGYHSPRATRRPTPLDPVELFGANHIWTLSVGVRLHAGTMRSRMGRYGLTL